MAVDDEKTGESTEDGELDGLERAALGAWTPLAPPAAFADRVIAAREPVERASRKLRVGLVTVGGLAAAAAVAIVVSVGAPRDKAAAASGSIEASDRTTAAIGERAVAVAEPRASLQWEVDGEGNASVEQRSGDVFYRVERGGAFVVHTPAGDVRVTGTCFRIEVEPMTKTRQWILSGTIGAAIATAVVVTVYEGHVVAETRTGKTELSAGSRAALAADGRTIVASASEGEPALDLVATREQLLTRTQTQRAEIAQLRARISQLQAQQPEQADEREGARDESDGVWVRPSEDILKKWAAQCRVRVDQPSLERFVPLKSLDKNPRGLEPSELEPYNAAMTEMAKQWRDTVRALYVEATGDTAGADTLSADAMQREIMEKTGTREEAHELNQRLSAERAGLAPVPADLSKTTTTERLLRAYLQLGDQSEAALAKRIGAERARAIRGDHWESSMDSSGCPEK